MSAPHVVLFTFGSAGDLHPYLAVGRALAARGLRVTIATSTFHRDAVERQRLAFAAVRPDLADLPTGSLARYMEAGRGTERVVRELVMPFLAHTYAATRALAERADLLVAHPLTFTVPMVAEQLGRPWASTVLAPLSYLSAHDPSVPPAWPFMERTRGWGVGFHRAFLALGRQVSLPWVREVIALRRRLGLADRGHPLFEGQHSPQLALALFSRELARPQPDWPAAAQVTGFPFVEDHADAPPVLRAFLDAGEPPLAFTLGTSAVRDPGAFFDVAAAATARRGLRAVLLTGRDNGWRPRGALPAGVLAVDYAPHAELFPRAAAIVHQGGIGTTAEALRAGRPMLVVPFSHDQFDNAARVARLGVAHRLARGRWRVAEVERALAALLADRALAERAAAVGARVRAERGAEDAAAAIAGLVGGATARAASAR